ncbi:membrane protein [Anaerocolumna cellulosilytica]|uniref:Membrane protein n=1 Tax=Anaerocolumna cellulosilytica TaxID=433286 RepID=A0A6S6QYV0_9FIRM|nr:DUF3810 domain-containing protein [Anaerocolumna cellulosilytica]MBB5196228.1 hypothetical protein [Anaerocolumna cellulosilytica]BCJ92452.1 membrane protein [Anaerocolumna cellulosilytica]
MNNRVTEHNKPDKRSETVTKMWYEGFLKKRVLLLFLTPVSLLLLWLVQKNTDIAEYVFARGIYKFLSQGISFLTGILPFSVMELEILLLPFLVIGYFIYQCYKIVRSLYRKQRDTGYQVITGFLNAGCTVSIIIFLYVILCGINYHRYSFGELTGLTIQDSSVEELYQLNVALAKEASELRYTLEQTEGVVQEDGTVSIELFDWKETADKAEDAYIKASETYPVLGGNYHSLKTVYFSEIMSMMEITGIFFPFTMEANVNIDVPDYSIPATMSHELAHLRGFMREDEANFIAYLVCKQSEDPVFQYSGTMLALTYASNQLYKQDEDLYYEVQGLFSKGMLADLREDYYYWAKFRNTAISAVSTAMNDNYLKANKQSDGVKSYGRMVDLLLAEYRHENEFE